MNRCCANRTSAYCPDCGAELNANPLAELLSHCRHLAERYERQESGGSVGWRGAAILWRERATALEALLEEEALRRA